MRISDWSSDVCSSDLDLVSGVEQGIAPPDSDYSYSGGKLTLPANASERGGIQPVVSASIDGKARAEVAVGDEFTLSAAAEVPAGLGTIVAVEWDFDGTGRFPVAEEGVDGTAESGRRSEEHTSELQSLMRISYAVFCLKKKNKN